MSNLTDALIAAKLLGNGGGGGGGGLPPITTETQTIMPEATLSFTNVGGMYTSPTDFIAADGAVYTVSWDGTDYTCTPLVMGGQYALGNMGLLGGKDTGEPFLMTNAMGNNMWATQSSAATHVCAISGAVQSPPDGSALVVVGGEWTTQDGYGYTKNDPDYGPVVTKIAKKYAPSAIVEAQGKSTISTVIRAGVVQMITAEIINPPDAEGIVMQFRIEGNTTPLIVQSGHVSGGNATLHVYNASSTDTSISTNDIVEMVIVQ